jgi:hypothetical protein
MAMFLFTGSCYRLPIPFAPAIYQFHFFFLSMSGRSAANWNFLLFMGSILNLLVGSGVRPVNLGNDVAGVVLHAVNTSVLLKPYAP